jgi:hypothetical protein
VSNRIHHDTSNRGHAVTESCNCTTNPNEHEHNYVRTDAASRAIGRPFHTVDSWRKRGVLPSVSEGYGQTKVCLCCAAELSGNASVRWERRVARRAGRSIRAKAKARARSVAA